MALRVVFMGTPEFALPSLKALLASPHEVVAVYTQPPRPAGRGLKLSKSPVHLLAESKKIQVFTPAHFKDPKNIETFRNHKIDAAVVVAYGLVLPETVLSTPRLGCLNIHASLLPRWRGAAPIARAILAGDRESGVTLMKMDKGLDTGPILQCKKLALTPTETTGTLHDRLAALGALMIVPALEEWNAGTLQEKIQDGHSASYAPKISKKECEIDWSVPAEAVDRQVRALSPTPGAWIQFQGMHLRILGGEATGGHGNPGEVLDDHMRIACGQGAYRVTRLQRSGKSPMNAADFLRGTPVAKGMHLK